MLKKRRGPCVSKERCLEVLTTRCLTDREVNE